MGIPIESDGSINIAELYQCHSRLRAVHTSRKAFPALLDPGVTQRYSYLYHQSFGSHANASPRPLPTPAGCPANGHADAGSPPPFCLWSWRFSLGHSSSCRFCGLLCRDSLLASGR
jgi:hypothetical protein